MPFWWEWQLALYILSDFPGIKNLNDLNSLNNLNNLSGLNGWAAKSLKPKIPPQEKAPRKIPPQENPYQQNASTGKYLPTKYL